jgi:hypothetical protein
MSTDNLVEQIKELTKTSWETMSIYEKLDSLLLMVSAHTYLLQSNSNSLDQHIKCLDAHNQAIAGLRDIVEVILEGKPTATPGELKQ